MKEKFKTIVIVIFILLCIGLYVSKEVTVIERTTTIDQLRKELIIRDSVIKLTEGMYQVAVNDNYTLSELNNSLKTQNSKLYGEIKNLKSRLLMYQTITVKPDDKIDTVTVHGEIDYKHIVSYYPDEQEVFVRFTRDYYDSTYVDEWKFNPIGIDIALTEVKENDFSVVVDAPKWIKVNAMSVKATPLPPAKPDNFDWYAAPSIGYNFIYQKPEFGVDVGFRYKKSLYMLGGNAYGSVWVRYGKMW